MSDVHFHSDTPGCGVGIPLIGGLFKMFRGRGVTLRWNDPITNRKPADRVMTQLIGIPIKNGKPDDVPRELAVRIDARRTFEYKTIRSIFNAYRLASSIQFIELAHWQMAEERFLRAFSEVISERIYIKTGRDCENDKDNPFYMEDICNAIDAGNAIINFIVSSPLMDEKIMQEIINYAVNMETACRYVKEKLGNPDADTSVVADAILSSAQEKYFPGQEVHFQMSLWQILKWSECESLEALCNDDEILQGVAAQLGN